ncbi:MAG: hypothetical protein FJ303_25230 [Planctomycetes bacterium]|nr:hypothetical protein [Planctomycetota bacterium]
MLSDDTHANQQKALQRFLLDLPQLFATHPGQWVAYQGDRRIGLAGQTHELYQKCFQQGLSRDEFVVFCIEAQVTEMVLGPMVSD